MRLGFHYHIPGYLKEGKIITMSLQGLFVDSLAPLCKKVIVFFHSPRPDEVSLMDYEIKSMNVELVNMGVHSSVPLRLLNSRTIVRNIEERVNELDVLLIRAPTPLLPIITKAVKKRIKVSYLVVGEMLEHIDNLPQPKWRKFLIGLFARWNEGKQIRYAKEVLVFSNSALIFEKYQKFAKRAVLIRTTTLSKSDFYIREDTCAGPEYNLLYTGRIERGKGLLEITIAVGMLNKENINCRLDIVGWAEPGDSTPEAISAEASKWDIVDKVIFHGKKKVGEELFRFYRKADIFVLASQVVEGFPRTITEALANSVPVISTNVGSIGFFHKNRHDIMFVEQKNALDITEKVKEIIANGELRRSLIKNGLKTVAEVTLDVQAEKICKELNIYQSNKF